MDQNRNNDFREEKRLESRKQAKKDSNNKKIFSVAIALFGVAAVLMVSLIIKLAKPSISKSKETEDKTLVTSTEGISKEQEEYVRRMFGANKILPNMYINEWPVGELTVRQAFDFIGEEIDKTEVKQKKVDLVFEGKKVSVQVKTFDEEGLLKVLEDAYAYGRDKSTEEKMEILQALEDEKKVFQWEVKEVEYAYVDEYLSDFEKDIYVPAQNASIEYSGGSINTLPGSMGIELDFLATKELLIEAMKSGQPEIMPVILEVEPDLTEEDVKKANSLLGSFSTKFAESAANRSSNIRVATNYVSGTVLQPGEIFSTNNTILETTVANGYKPAPSIIDGDFVDDLGGGVCQVSSTLYAAVLRAELEVVERKNHGLKVGYMDWAYDATLSRGHIDFRFQNNTEYPIVIVGSAQNGNLTINIFGYESRPANRTISFYNQHVKTTPPAPIKEVEDETLPMGKTVIDKPERIGQVYNLYKNIMIDGKVVETEHVNTSTYRAVQGVMRVGTGPAVEGEPLESDPMEGGEVIEPPVEEGSTEEPPIEEPTEELPGPSEVALPSEEVPEESQPPVMDD